MELQTKVLKPTDSLNLTGFKIELMRVVIEYAEAKADSQSRNPKVAAEARRDANREYANLHRLISQVTAIE